MLVDAALGFVNHLLTGDDWARTRLKPFAGQCVRVELGALTLPVVISRSGLFIAGDRRATANVTISLPADAPLRALSDRPSLFAAAHISGSAELAETLGFILRNLSWDAEGDLAQVVGDITAHRLVAGGRQLARWQRQQAINLAFNLAEYFTEENPTIARRQDVADFCAETTGLQDLMARLEARIAVLER